MYSCPLALLDGVGLVYGLALAQSAAQVFGSGVNVPWLVGACDWVGCPDRVSLHW